MTKKIVIFGASGMVGLCAIEEALKKDFQVRAFVRDAKKLPAHLADKVEAFEGNALEPDSAAKACEGVDAVVICLGTSGSLAPTTLLSEGTKNIINGMLKNNLKVVSACINGYLFYEKWENIPMMFRDITVDHKRMRDYLRESSLDYIAVCPPHITEEQSQDTVVRINPGPMKPRRRFITKWDLAKFLVDCLDDPQYYRVDVAITNPQGVPT